MKNQTGNAGVISEYSSEYLTNGQKSKEISTIQDKEGKKETKTAAYAYDLLGRIMKETKTGNEDITYTYDGNNNRKEMTIGNKVTAYKYNKNDELFRTDTLNTETEEDSVVIYKNDRNGNQLATVNRYTIPADKKDGSYVDVDVTLGDNQLNDNVVNHYNALNQLTRTLTKDYKVGFTYDAEGLRTSKTVNGKTSIYVWDGDQIVMELSEGGKVKKRYIRGNDLVYKDEGESTEKQYYVTNPHGDVIQLTDENGNVIKSYEYDSMGNEVSPEKKDENPFRYCGEYYDKETGEIYLRARYYQPEVGRFITRDTYTGEDDEPLSLHLYTYCENDGVNNVDPSGHWKKTLVHKRMTKIIAKYVGFSKKDAALIAEGTKAADALYKAKGRKWQTKIPGTNITIKLKDLVGLKAKRDVYKSKSGPSKGKNKVSLHRITKKRYKKGQSQKFIKSKIKKIKNRKKKLVLIGLWLHPLQDRWAHGFIKPRRKHTERTDDVHYDYVNGKYKRVKLTELESNRRFNNTIKVTKKYLKNAKKVMGIKNKYVNSNGMTMIKEIKYLLRGIKVMSGEVINVGMVDGVVQQN